MTCVKVELLKTKPKDRCYPIRYEQDMRYKQVIIECSFKHWLTNATICYKTSRPNIYR